MSSDNTCLWLVIIFQATVIRELLPNKTDQIMFCGLSQFQVEVFNYLLTQPQTAQVHSLFWLVNTNSPGFWLVVQLLSALDTCVCGKNISRYRCCFKTQFDNYDPLPVILQTMQIFLKVATSHVTARSAASWTISPGGQSRCSHTSRVNNFSSTSPAWKR